MTNEQLAVFLTFLADQLESEIDTLSELLPPDTERYLEWWKGDFPRKGLEMLLPESELKANGFEQKPTGDFVALDGLHVFLDKIRHHAATLLNETEF